MTSHLSDKVKKTEQILKKDKTPIQYKFFRLETNQEKANNNLSYRFTATKTFSSKLGFVKKNQTTFRQLEFEMGCEVECFSCKLAKVNSNSYIVQDTKVKIINKK